MANRPIHIALFDVMRSVLTPHQETELGGFLRQQAFLLEWKLTIDRLQVRVDPSIITDTTNPRQVEWAQLRFAGDTPILHLAEYPSLGNKNLLMVRNRVSAAMVYFNRGPRKWTFMSEDKFIHPLEFLVGDVFGKGQLIDLAYVFEQFVEKAHAADGIEQDALLAKAALAYKNMKNNIRITMAGRTGLAPPPLWDANLILRFNAMGLERVDQFYANKGGLWSIAVKQSAQAQFHRTSIPP